MTTRHLGRVAAAASATGTVAPLRAFLAAAQAPSRVLPTDAALWAALSTRASVRVVTVNLFELCHYARDRRYRSVVDAADAWTADGWPVVVALRAVGVRTSRTTGSGLCGTLLTAPRTDGLLRLAVLGSTPDVVREFTRRANAAGRTVVFADTGHRDDWSRKDVGSALRDAGPELVLVGVGTPYGSPAAASVAGIVTCPVVPVGAGMGMAVGMERRAPPAFQLMRLEWLWRLATDPRRLAKRYLIECVGLLPALFIAIAAVRQAPKMLPR